METSLFRANLLWDFIDPVDNHSKESDLVPSESGSSMPVTVRIRIER